ncbi:hypothetical protein EAH89_18960 [Roseomonas nepalensis]|uniref:site-specific DNA-methyltransferase (adenine-specific) n=1 Tax=Muricoccus nepalensis TaxID=1854500 RepID=A0A502FS81_9PROT|nr:site-specific DNA-methyltransferase [Roseomonas nepalensis]TPG52315.1 hypothetical protein EAH89_18960 [Roseomonas nepalensis]
MQYDDLTHEQLVSLLVKRDAQRRLGLVWERDEIAHDQALNGDFVAMNLDLGGNGSCGPGPWGNLVIEADNFDALRWLRMTHAGQIRCILIDPPYNTGNQDFAYNDRFVGADDRFRQSTWLEFLYRRMTLARDLLTEDGVIMVCINDDNRSKLDLLMEDVFPGMRVGSFVWKTRSGSNDHGDHSFSVDHEHILVYAKPGFEFTGAAKDFRQYKNLDGDPLGAWKTGDLTKGHSFKERPRAYYPVQTRRPASGIHAIPPGCGRSRRSSLRPLGRERCSRGRPARTPSRGSPRRGSRPWRNGSGARRSCGRTRLPSGWSFGRPRKRCSAPSPRATSPRRTADEHPSCGRICPIWISGWASP